MYEILFFFVHKNSEIARTCFLMSEIYHTTDTEKPIASWELFWTPRSFQFYLGLPILCKYMHSRILWMQRQLVLFYFIHLSYATYYHCHLKLCNVVDSFISCEYHYRCIHRMTWQRTFINNFIPVVSVVYSNIKQTEYAHAIYVK